MRVPIVVSSDLRLPDDDAIWEVVRIAATIPDPRWDPSALYRLASIGPTHTAAARGSCIQIERGVARRVIRALVRAGYEPDVIDNRVDARAPWPAYRGPELRDSQREAVERILQRREGVVVIPTGGGKTLTILYAAYQSGRRTLIVPPRVNLAEQWEAEFRKSWAVRDGDVGRIYGGEESVGSVVTFGLPGSVLPRLERLRDAFGFVGIDEAQFAGANETYEVSRGFPSLYRVATSADPERQDGGEVLVRSAFGPVIFSRDRTDGEDEGSVVAVTTRVVPYACHRLLPRDTSARERVMMADDERLDVLDNIVGTAPPGVLVLVRLVESARLLARRWGAGLMLGRGNGRDARVEFDRARARLTSGENRVAVATWSSVGVGTDIPGLTSLVLASPPGRGERGYLPFNQNRGRAARTGPDKGLGYVYLLWDQGRISRVADLVASWNDGRVEVAADRTLQTWRPPRPGELL